MCVFMWVSVGECVCVCVFMWVSVCVCVYFSGLCVCMRVIWLDDKFDGSDSEEVSVHICSTRMFCPQS